MTTNIIFNPRSDRKADAKPWLYRDCSLGKRHGRRFATLLDAIAFRDAGGFAAEQTSTPIERRLRHPRHGDSHDYGSRDHDRRGTHVVGRQRADLDLIGPQIDAILGPDTWEYKHAGVSDNECAEFAIIEWCDASQHGGEPLILVRPVEPTSDMKAVYEHTGIEWTTLTRLGVTLVARAA